MMDITNFAPWKPSPVFTGVALKESSFKIVALIPLHFQAPFLCHLSSMCYLPSFYGGVDLINEVKFLALIFQKNYPRGLTVTLSLCTFYYFSGISGSSSLPTLLPSGDLTHSLVTGVVRKTTGTTHLMRLVRAGDWIFIITLRLLHVDRYCIYKYFAWAVSCFSFQWYKAVSDHPP